MGKMSARAALAASLGMEFKELGDYRYHFEKTKKPLYLVGDEYFAMGLTEPTIADFNGM